MITNLPTSRDYNIVAKQCLVQAFKIVYEVDKDLVYIDDDIDDEVWEHHSGEFKTSIILVYQAIEAFMKGRICDSSPLLLLESKRTDWPTHPGSSDIDFSELYTIGAEALQRTYCAVEQSKINDDILRFIDGIRTKRNKIIHGVSNEYLDPEYLLEIILETFTIFAGKDSWWVTLREFYLTSPAFGYYDHEYDEAMLMEMLNYAERILDPPEFRKHFTLNLKRRRYYCPWCYESLQNKGTDLEYKFGLLIPQTNAGVTNLMCISCQRVSTVLREDCDRDCKGNVLMENSSDEKICLTCGHNLHRL